MKKFVRLALTIINILPSLAYAADGGLDTTFGSGGIVITDFGGYDFASALALQSDGKIVAAGTTRSGPGGTSKFALARYNSDGSLDTTFGTGGKVTTDSSGDGFALVIRSDGKIVVAGGSARPSLVLAQYNRDGSLDTTFGSGGKVVRSDFSGFDVSLVLQPDGKIVVAGGAGDFALARYNSDGSLDTTFGSGGLVTTDFSGRDDEAYAAAIQSDGKIVAAGRTTTRSGTILSNFALARYNSNGSLDTTFGMGGKVITSFASNDFGSAYTLALQSDGKIVAAGGGYDVESGIRLARYNSDGSLDATFGSGGKVGPSVPVSDPDAKSLAIQPDGKIVVSTIPFVSDIGLIRYNNDGSLDRTFGTGGYVSGDGAYAVVLQPDGKIVAAGQTCVSYPDCDFWLARYNSGLGSAPVNVALVSNGGVATASSSLSSAWGPSGANDGDRKGVNWGAGGGWADGTPGVWPDWLEVDFNGIKTINEVDVFTVQDNYQSPSDPTPTMTFSLYGLTDFQVQYWTGSVWITVPGGVASGNNLVWRQFTFSPLTTSAIRVWVTGALASYSRITEVEAYTQ